MKNKQEMYSLVQRWFKSPGLKEDFCNRHGVKIHKLNYWIKKYNKETGSRPSSTVSEGFVPITVKGSTTKESTPKPEIELDLPHGIRLRIF